MCGADPGVNCAGRTCGACPSGFACNGGGTGCAVNPSSNWIVTAVSGTVGASPPGGGSWDVGGSAPDPYLCLTINGMQMCTEYIDDTFTPRWTMRVRFPATTASALLAGVPSTYGDDDVGPDHVICMGTVRFTAADFSTRMQTFRCDPYGAFTLTLAPAP